MFNTESLKHAFEHRDQAAAKTKLGLTQRRRGTRRNAEKMKSLRIWSAL
jgi:hypothetical protein